MVKFGKRDRDEDDKPKKKKAKSKNGITYEDKRCITHMFRVSYPAVFEPKVHKDRNGKESKPRYQLTMLFDKKIDLSESANGQKNSIEDIIYNACVEAWGKDEDDWPEDWKHPFKNGDKAKNDPEGYAGTNYAQAWSYQQPGLIDRDKREILDEEDFYPGCYARAEITAFVYDDSGNCGVSLGLQNIQKIRDGESFSSKRRAEDVFDFVEDDEDEGRSRKSKRRRDEEDDDEDDRRSRRRRRSRDDDDEVDVGF